MKAWENKKVLDTTLNRNAMFNAYINANRKKGKSFIKLFKHTNHNKMTRQEINKIFNEVSKEDNSSWVKLLYKERG